MIKQSLWEWFWPGARLKRTIRMLDAEERIGASIMLREWHAFQAKEAWRQYHKPLVMRSIV